MSKKLFLKRYHLIINRLRKSGASFDDIAAHMRRQSDLDGENYDVSQRTFQRDVQEIASIYNIEIAYNRGQNLYEITHDAYDDRTEQLIESYEMINALKLSGQYSHHMVLEKRRPAGTEHLLGLLHAIKNNTEVTFNHEKYWDDDDIQVRHVQPLALKEARNRWYVVANDTRDGKIKTFGLDRISELDITRQKFTPQTGFHADTYFQYSFGVINEHLPPQKIILSFSKGEANYIKSLPLHHSQQLISEDDQATVFKLYLYPTYDFVMELMSFGKEVTVLEPLGLREEIVGKMMEAVANYVIR